MTACELPIRNLPGSCLPISSDAREQIACKRILSWKLRSSPARFIRREDYAA